MASKKISTKQKKSAPKKVKVNGVVFTEYSPKADLASRTPKEMATALAQCLLDGDKEAFQEILEGYIKAKNIAQVAKDVGLSRSIIYEVMNAGKNPTLTSICAVMKAFRPEELSA